MQTETIRFRHAHFSARFPVGFRYAPSHYWMSPVEGGAWNAASAERGRIWRVGFTKFATRMLGELVEMVVEVAPGGGVRGGDRLGTVEGFKAVSDLYCVMDGKLLGTNAALTAEACLTHADPYGTGWLYEVEGEPAAGHLDVHAYVALLSETIDRLQASRYSDGDSNAPADEVKP
jgi:glycine cleavage system H protein